MDMHFEGVIFQTHAAELSRRIRHPHPPFSVLDLRSPAEFARGRVPGALSVTAEDLREGLPPGTTPTTEFFVVGSGPSDPAVRAASQALGAHGAQRRVEMPAGMLEWEQLDLPTESGGAAAA